MTLSPAEMAKLEAIIEGNAKAPDKPGIEIKNGHYVGPYRPYMSVGQKQTELKDLPPKLESDGTRSIEVFFLSKDRHIELTNLGFSPCPVPSINEPKGVDAGRDAKGINLANRPKKRRTSKQVTNGMDSNK